MTPLRAIAILTCALFMPIYTMPKMIDTVLVNCSGIGYPHSPCFLTPDVEVLDLSYNNITMIQQQNFQNLNKLRKLFLQFNHITAIEPGSFAKNSELRYLDLSNNLLQDISVLPFNHLQSLTHLDITNNMFDTADFGAEINKLQKLHSLRFGNTRLSSLNSGSLSVLQGIPLKDVYLITGDLQAFEPGTFNALQNVEKLSLDLQFGQDGKLLINIFQDIPMSTTTLEILNSDFVKKASNVDFFFPLKKLNISTLVAHNITIDDSLTTYLLNSVLGSNIKELVLDTIIMDGIGNWDVIPIPSDQINLRKLQILNVENPNFYHFYSLEYLIDIFAQLTELMILKGNLFYVPCQISEIMTYLRHLDISFNLLQEFSFIPGKCSAPFPNLNTLIANNNKFSNLPKFSTLLSKMEKLSSINASHNDLVLQKGLTCTWPQTLKCINFSHNNLEGNVFGCLPASLQSLDLSYNSITAVPNLKGLRNLREIFLTENFIASFPEIPVGYSLKVLHIDQNKITDINIRFLQSLDLAELKFSNNPLECFCAIQSVSNYVQQRRVVILDWPDRYRCESPRKFKGQIIQALKFSPIECKIPLFVGVLLACVALLVGVCIVLCIKFNITWYCRTLWLWLKAKKSLDANLVEKNFEYNAFVSYSEYDSAWVKNKLLIQLENNEPPYRICIHERDFKPGKPIINNIIDCISKSYKTIFILSKHFVQSEWCHYEFFFAHQQIFDDKKDSLILLLLEPIPKNSIPDRFCKLRKLMNRNTYLEWPQNEFQQGFFWKRLKAVLNLDFHSCSSRVTLQGVIQEPDEIPDRV
ncbi:toll-like receptor 2 [Rhincodon typus]|uniref:toll-like receptor 2 n=1 Tax=Rhincodon typus TaxID=259920 RepID=UPI0009A44DBD|nr:toll-like receptor 2 [Rhincodon typus]